MGKFMNGLSKFGKRVGAALTSETAKRIARATGTAIQRAAESELGSAAIEGVVQGALRAAITGEPLGDSIKTTVIHNLTGVDPATPDPLNVSEQRVTQELHEVERRVREDELREKIKDLEIVKDQQELKTQLTKVKNYLDKEMKAEIAEENQIEVLESAVKSMELLAVNQDEGLQKIRRALVKENRERTAAERRIVTEVKQRYDVLAEAVNTERDSIQEEAVQEIIDISTEVLEHAAEEVPVGGAAVATGIATARAVAGAFKLKKIIEDLSGVSLPHADFPVVSPSTVQDMLRLSNQQTEVPEHLILQSINRKLQHVDVLRKEVGHFTKEVLPVVKAKAAEDQRKYGMQGKALHPLTKARLAPSVREEAGVHIYSAPWDSDQVFFLYVVGPMHAAQAFFLGFDLFNEFVFYADVEAPPNQYARRAAADTEVYGFTQVYREFFMHASRGSDVRMHVERLQRSMFSAPIHIGKLTPRAHYGELREHAMRIGQDVELQKHILRGPLSMQRRNILGAVLHGATVLNSSRMNELYR
uniref:Outer capsid protein VP5 n=1 Tax=Ninarumi virus TaxID=2108521 RepID=A0A2P1K543_9REOV|nr:VP5 [Ninarumi virus]